MYMGFENEYSSPPSTSSLLTSSSSSNSILISPLICTPPNPNPSHKRKAGRKKFRETRHPVYRGVRQRNGNKWVCEVREPNKKSRIWVGTYPTPEMAATAHDVAVLALKGTSAEFNFPHSALPLARSCSPSDIRAAAAKATQHAFKPNTTNSYSLLDSTTSTTSADPNYNCHHHHHHNVVTNNNNNNTNTINDEEESKKETLFLDEEALYNMPGLLDSMAEGLLITPPSMKRPIMDWDHVDDIASEYSDLTLWTH